jgi:hypothetical protein
MNLPRPRVLALGGVGLVSLIAVLTMLGSATGEAERELLTRVERGDFKVVVTTTGELRARKFVQIQGPSNAQQAQQYQMRICGEGPGNCACASESRGAVRASTARFDAHARAGTRRYSQPRVCTRGKTDHQGSIHLRGALRQAPGRDRTGQGQARVRTGKSELHHQETAGGSQNARGWR